MRTAIAFALTLILGVSACGPGEVTPQPSQAVARCGDTVSKTGKFGTLRSGTAQLPVLDLGAGPTAAVFIHQTDGDGLCGFAPYAAWLTSRFNVRAVLFDLCSYGEATCPGAVFAQDQVGQVAMAIAHARSIPGVRRVVVVGASMGGALALAAAGREEVDAVVDLSGPTGWPGALAERVAPAVQIPCLVVASPGDGSANYDEIKAAFTKVRGRPKRFITGDGEHGWNLLGDSPSWTPLATVVASWIQGNYR